MRYELSDNEWATIKPMLPNNARGVPRVDDGVSNKIKQCRRAGVPIRFISRNRTRSVK